MHGMTLRRLVRHYDVWHDISTHGMTYDGWHDITTHVRHYDAWHAITTHGMPLRLNDKCCNNATPVFSTFADLYANTLHILTSVTVQHYLKQGELKGGH